MTETAPPLEYVAPAAWRRAVVEILGTEGETWLQAANAAAPWEGLLDWLCGRYGRNAGLGAGLRVGRAFARHALPLSATEAGFREAEFRFLPWHRKMPAGLARLAALASRWFAAPVEVQPRPTGALWQASACPFAAAGFPQQECTPWVGFLQEALYWLSGGHLFAVQPQPDASPGVSLFVPLRPLH